MHIELRSNVQSTHRGGTNFRESNSARKPFLRGRSRRNNHVVTSVISDGTDHGIIQHLNLRRTTSSKISPCLRIFISSLSRIIIPRCLFGVSSLQIPKLPFFRLPKVPSTFLYIRIYLNSYALQLPSSRIPSLPYLHIHILIHLRVSCPEHVSSTVPCVSRSIPLYPSNFL